MYLHVVCRTLTVVVAAMLFAPPVTADETRNPTIIAVSQSAVGSVTPIGSIWRQIQKTTASFCGACSKSDHDACGGKSNGWSCCSAGCSDDKMQCWNVTGCDKIAALETIPQPPARGDPLRALRRPQTRIAQGDQCANWYSNLQAELSSFNSQCSGELAEDQYQYCVNWQEQIDSNIAAYNAQCG